MKNNVSNTKLITKNIENTKLNTKNTELITTNTNTIDLITKNTKKLRLSRNILTGTAMRWTEDVTPMTLISLN